MAIGQGLHSWTDKDYLFGLLHCSNIDIKIMIGMMRNKIDASKQVLLVQ